MRICRWWGSRSRSPSGWRSCAGRCGRDSALRGGGRSPSSWRAPRSSAWSSSAVARSRYGAITNRSSRALEVTEGNYLAHYNLGTRALTSRPPRLGEARSHLEAAVRLDPGYAEAHLNLGKVEWFEGDAVRATACYETAVSLDPSDPEAHVSLGTVRFEAGRADESLAHFERAIALEPSNAKAHANRATVLLNLGRIAEARRGFERALALDPAMEAAREGLRAANAD